MYSRLRKRDKDEKKIETWLLDEIVVLHNQLIELRRIKAESQKKILALQEAYGCEKTKRNPENEPRLIHDAEPELARLVRRKHEHGSHNMQNSSY